MNIYLTALKRTGVIFMAVFMVFLYDLRGSKADCGYEMSPPDSNIVFDGPCGTVMAKSFTITNTTDSSLTVNFSVDQPDIFSVSPERVVLQYGASQDVTVSFIANAAVDVSGELTIYTSTKQCSKNIALIGRIDSSVLHTQPCLSAALSESYLDPIIFGGSAQRAINLSNSSNFDIQVNKADISGSDASAFAVTSQLPLVVPANSNNTTVQYRFTPTSSDGGITVNEEFIASILLSLSGDSLQCQTATGELIGFTDKPGDPSNNTIDTTIRPLFPNDKRTLSIESSGFLALSTFTFYNNLAVDATVTKIYLGKGNYFSINSYRPSPTPVLLHPGEKISIVVAYSATDNLLHDDQLVIEANHQLQSMSFDLQGKNLAAASVPNADQANVAIDILPNPAFGQVTIKQSQARKADLQIVDMNGNTVASAKNITSWKWDVADVSSGTYIVRISCVSMEGKNFVISRSIKVTK